MVATGARVDATPKGAPATPDVTFASDCWVDVTIPEGAATDGIPDGTVANVAEVVAGDEGNPLQTPLMHVSNAQWAFDLQGDWKLPHRGMTIELTAKHVAPPMHWSGSDGEQVWPRAIVPLSEPVEAGVDDVVEAKDAETIVEENNPLQKPLTQLLKAH